MKGSGVWGFGFFKVEGQCLGSEFQGSGSRQGAGSRVQGLGCGVQVQGSGFRGEDPTQGVGFRGKLEINSLERRFLDALPSSLPRAKVYSSVDSSIILQT